jgi:hypothetical protein
MDWNLVVQALSSFGFPVVVCGVLFWVLLKNTEAHKAESDAFTKALNENSMVLNELKVIIQERVGKKS